MTRFAAFATLFVLIAGGFGYATLRSFNHFETVERAFSGRCQAVTGLSGPEDLQIDPAQARAFISSLDRRDKDARGAIHLFDLEDPLDEAAWRDRTGGVPEAFRPLGLYYYEAGDVERLFVVNEANNAVELFAVDETGDLAHLETFTERRMTSPNDVVAVGPQSFYVTNDVKSGREGALASILFMTRAGAGEVLFVDRGEWRVVAEDLRFANGVNVSPDGERLYVAETAGGVLRVYERNRANGRLKLMGSIDIDGGPENINVDPSGVLWVGALPKPLIVPIHERDPAVAAPSLVVRIDIAKGRAEAVYRDDGTEISAATSAARLGRTLLIGSLFEKKFLICNLPPDRT